MNTRNILLIVNIFTWLGVFEMSRMIDYIKVNKTIGQNYGELFDWLTYGK